MTVVMIAQQHFVMLSFLQISKDIFVIVLTCFAHPVFVTHSCYVCSFIIPLGKTERTAHKTLL